MQERQVASHVLQGCDTAILLVVTSVSEECTTFIVRAEVSQDQPITKLNKGSLAYIVKYPLLCKTIPVYETQLDGIIGMGQKEGT